jgi:ATP phosphoribosyltransferase
MTDAPLVLAVPSKGRLQENAHAFFTRAGLPMLQSGGERTYRGQIGGLGDVEIAYLSASEITRELAAGSVHLGVTGRDLVEEQVPDFAERLDLVLPLGFGHADVVVAVPEAWIDVRSMADLDDVAADFRSRHGRWLTVATKYVNLTRRFFDANGIADYRIIESLGATEGAPASGAADLIVDITSTGSTLAANALKIVGEGVILRSEAHLVASLSASWSGGARGALRTILDRIEAEAAGRSWREIRADVADAEGAARVAQDRFATTTPFGTPPGPLTLHCEASKVYACAEWLRTGAGARTVTVARLDTVFSSTSPLAERLLGRLDGHMAS